MSQLTPKQIAAFAAAVAAMSAASAQARTLDQARNQVSSVMAGKVELLERSENPSIPQATVDKLQAELRSCGIAETGPRCLDGSAFSDYGPLRGEASKNNYIVTNEGWVFFSRFQVKSNARKDNPYLVMAVRARKADTMPAFINGTIYAIPAGHESQDMIKKDFQQCMDALASPTNTALTCPLNGFLAYEMMTDQGALEVLGGNADASDFRRFYHSAEVAFAVKNPKPTYVAAVSRAIKARYSIVTDSGNDKYATAFTNLLGAASKTASYKTLATDIVSDMFDKADRGSQNELAIAIQMANQGIPNDRIEAVLVNGFRSASCGPRVRGACFPEDQRRAAVAAYGQAAVDKDAFIALLADDDNLVRSQAYFTVRDKKIVLTNDNLDAIQAIIDSPKSNVRGNVIAALSLIDTDEASILLAITVQDKDVDVALSAYNKVEPRLTKLATKPRSDKYAMSAERLAQTIRNMAVAAVPRGQREQAALDQLLARRAKLLGTLAAKARQISGDAKVAAQLSLLTAVDETIVRQDVARILGDVADASAITTLLQLFTDRDIIVRAAADASLSKKAQLLTDANVDLLFQAANFTADAGIRAKAVGYLGAIKSDRAVRALTFKSSENIDENSPSVRKAAAVALAGFVGTLYDNSATVSLIPMLVDSVKEVRDAAVAGMQNRYLGNETDNSFVQTLSMYLTNQDPEGIRNVIDAIARVSSRFAAETLGKFANEGFELRPDVRLYVVQKLSANTSADATNAIIGFMADSNAEVRAAAQAPLSIRSFSDANVESLGSFLSRTDVLAEVRSNVAGLLGTTSSQRAYDLLVAQQRRETDSVVRTQIDAAIASILTRITPRVN